MAAKGIKTKKKVRSNKIMNYKRNVNFEGSIGIFYPEDVKMEDIPTSVKETLVESLVKLRTVPRIELDGNIEDSAFEEWYEPGVNILEEDEAGEIWDNAKLKISGKLVELKQSGEIIDVIYSGTTSVEFDRKLPEDMAEELAGKLSVARSIISESRDDVKEKEAFNKWFAKNKNLIDESLAKRLWDESSLAISGTWY
jgi:hypothetical protein